MKIRTQKPVCKNIWKEDAGMLLSINKKKRKPNRDPKSAATSNFILNVVVVMILAK